MSLFKRATSGFFARIEQIIGDIENHDALIKAAIKEQKHNLAYAKVQFNKVDASYRQINQQIIELTKKKQQWATRALACDEKEEQQALICMQRRHDISLQIAKLEKSRSEYQATLDKMQSEIRDCEEQLKDISQKHQLMKARQSSIESRNAIHREPGFSIDELNESFDRWQVRITESELTNTPYANSCLDDIDPVEAEYQQQESTEALREQLASLKQQAKKAGTQ